MICLSYYRIIILMNYFCLVFFLPISLSLQCHVSCVPVFNSMSKKEIKPWGIVVTLSMIICLFVYTGTGNVNESVYIVLMAKDKYHVAALQVSGLVICHQYWNVCALCSIRRLWLPDVWLQRQSGRVDVVPSWWHCRGHCKSFHRYLCGHVLPHSTLLWQVRYRQK